MGGTANTSQQLRQPNRMKIWRAKNINNARRQVANFIRRRRYRERVRAEIIHQNHTLRRDNNKHSKRLQRMQHTREEQQHLKRIEYAKRTPSQKQNTVGTIPSECDNDEPQ
jgi:hypothetical protein